jgi:hypothetical protein
VYQGGAHAKFTALAGKVPDRDAVYRRDAHAKSTALAGKVPDRDAVFQRDAHAKFPALAGKVPATTFAARTAWSTGVFPASRSHSSSLNSYFVFIS